MPHIHLFPLLSAWLRLTSSKVLRWFQHYGDVCFGFKWFLKTGICNLENFEILISSKVCACFWI